MDLPFFCLLVLILDNFSTRTEGNSVKTAAADDLGMPQPACQAPLTRKTAERGKILAPTVALQTTHVRAR